MEGGDACGVRPVFAGSRGLVGELASGGERKCGCLTTDVLLLVELLLFRGTVGGFCFGRRIDFFFAELKAVVVLAEVGDFGE